MRASVPCLLGAMTVGALAAAFGYASCGAQKGDSDRTVSDNALLGRSDYGDPSTRASDTARPAGSLHRAAADPRERKANGAPDHRSPVGGRAATPPAHAERAADDDGAAPPATSTLGGHDATRTAVPVATVGVSVGGLKYSTPNGGQGPCGCKLSEVCLRTPTGVGALVDHCLPRPNNCPELSCSCFAADPCPTPRQTCVDDPTMAEPNAGLLLCATRGGVP